MAATTAMTGAQFDALPYEEVRRWELINGELIAMPGATPRHQYLVSRVLIALWFFIETAKNGALALPDVEFALTDLDRVRPDVCVLLKEKADRLDRDKIPIPGAPDIAIEVISPSESASESHEKVRVYLRNGTAEVWQVYPKSRTVQIHRREISHSFEADQHIATDLLPGFDLPLTSLFK
jgi:Uma2 family endonuclease